MIGNPYIPEVDPNIAAEAFANGLLANLTANGGVNGGNLAKTTQIVLKTTTENRVQLGSCEDGNEVTFYASGDDFSNGVVKTRVFLSKGEVYIENGVVDGAVITSTKGIWGASGNSLGAQSPMPLGVEGYAARQFFLFAFRNSSDPDPTGNNRGEVYVAAGAVSADVELLTGDGQTVVDSASLAPFQVATLLTNANSEFQVVATQPVFVGIAARMGDNANFYDMRLVPPLTTQLIGQNRNCRMSALYDNTKVRWYRQNGELGEFTVSPGSPVNIYTGTINELGDVFHMDSNAVPATAGTFDLNYTMPDTTSVRMTASTTRVTYETVVDGLDTVLCCSFTTPATFPAVGVNEVIFECGGATTGLGAYLNSTGAIEFYSNTGLPQGSPRVATTALIASTSYDLIMELDTTNTLVKIHIVAASNFSWWTPGRTSEFSYIPPNSDYTGADDAGYGILGLSAGGISTGANVVAFTGTLDSDFVIQSNQSVAIYASLTRSLTLPYNANSSQISTALIGDGLTTSDFEIDFQLGTNLGEASARVYLIFKGIFERLLASPSITTTGLTGNIHTLTVYQTGTQAGNAGSNTDYAKEGIVNIVANGPISGLSGADGSGLEATYYVPTSGLTQRIPIPLGFPVDGNTNGDIAGIAVQSLYKGSYKLFDANKNLILSGTFDRDPSLATPVCEFEQRFPCGITIGDGVGAGIDVDIGQDWLGGYIETDVPINIILNTDENDQVISGGIETNADEIVCFGVTPENIRTEITTATDGRLRKRSIDNTGSEVWDLL